MAGKTDRRKSRPFLFLGLFLLVWWGIPTSWKLLTKSAFREFQAPFWELSSRIDDLSDYWGHLSDSKNTLIEKGKEASRLQADLNLQTQASNDARLEIDRLKSLKSDLAELEGSLRLDASQGFEPVVARISLRSLSGWWQKITIRKGKIHGLKPGLGVIFKGGVIGRTTSVNSRSSEIELITNPTFRIVAHFQGDNRPITFQGIGIAGGGSPRGIASGIPHDLIANPDTPLNLVSSSLGGTFPQGIPIGKIHKLDGGEDGLFKSGKVMLDPDLSQAREVTILVPR